MDSFVYLTLTLPIKLPGWFCPTSESSKAGPVSIHTLETHAITLIVVKLNHCQCKGLMVGS